jgi:hypothetical protein
MIQSPLSPRYTLRRSISELVRRSLLGNAVVLQPVIKELSCGSHPMFC